MYGTDDGVYLSNLLERNREPIKVLALKDVAQIDVLEDYQLLIVLSGMNDACILCPGMVFLTCNCRATSHHVPVGRVRSHGPIGWSQARKEDSLPHILL